MYDIIFFDPNNTNLEWYYTARDMEDVSHYISYYAERNRQENRKFSVQIKSIKLNKREWNKRQKENVK